MRLSPYFSREEFECKCGCGMATVDAELLFILDDIRINLVSPVHITSGHRCRTHNKSVGGAKDSYHVQGRAADIKVSGFEPKDVYNYLCEKHKTKYGFLCYETFVHVDSRETPYRKSC